MGEDTITNIRVAFNNTKNVIRTTYQLYLYRQHPASIMHSFNEGVEYEERFLEHLQQSIPPTELDKYRKYIIIRKIKTFDFHFGWSADIPKWKGYKFYNTLLEDIKEQHIKELFIERLLITVCNKNTRKVLILLKRIKNKLFGQDTLI